MRKVSVTVTIVISEDIPHGDRRIDRGPRRTRQLVARWAIRMQNHYHKLRNRCHQLYSMNGSCFMLRGGMVVIGFIASTSLEAHSESGVSIVGKQERKLEQ